MSLRGASSALIVAAAIMGLAAVVGGWVYVAGEFRGLRESTQALTVAVEGRDGAVRTRRAEWTCRDGELVVVELTSAAGEDRDVFFRRFESDLNATEKDHPRR